MSYIELRFHCTAQQLKIKRGPIRVNFLDKDLGAVGISLLAFDDTGIFITFEIQSSLSLPVNAARDKAHRLVESLLTRLALEADFGPGPARLISDNLSQAHTGASIIKIRDIDSNHKEIYASDSIAITTSAIGGSLERVFIVGDGDEDRLENALSNEKLSGTPYHVMYRDALRSSDPVAQFMFLYMLLNCLVPGSQDRIDDYIVIQEPGVVRTAKPRIPKLGKGNILETLYTRLRNEVGHGSERNTNIDKTRQEIVSSLGQFRNLVKQAIVNNQRT